MYLSNVKRPKSIGDENILKIAKYNLLFEYQAFGILEKMDKSIEMFKYKKPSWLSFDVDFPRKNTYDSSPELRSDVIELITTNNALDAELYNFALEQFDAL